MSRSEIVVEVDNEIYTNWESVRIEMSLDTMSRTFNMDVHDETGVTSKLVPGVACKVYAVESLDNIQLTHKILTGWVQDVDRSIDDGGERVTIQGGDNTVDLLTCSIVRTSSTWANAKVSKIIIDICDPFGITVDASRLPEDPVVKDFTIQQGETAFAAIERLCRFLGVLPLATPDGRLALENTGTLEASEPVEVGRNAISFGHSNSDRERHHEYTGKARAKGRGAKWTEKQLRLKALSFDTTVTRYRPLVFMAESRSDKKNLATRVNWEANIRAARANEYSATVKDFFQFDEKGAIVTLWTLNELVTLIADRWGLKATALISSVSYEISEGGRRTYMTFRNPGAYEANPEEQVIE